MFDGTAESIKMFFSAAAAAGAALVGASFKYIAVLALLMTVDTIFGWVKAKKLKNWSSGAARWGAIGKIIELMLIGVLYMLDAAFGTEFLEYMGIFYFGACELASIIENYAEINGNLPEGTLDFVKKLQFNVGTAVMQRIKKAFYGLMGIDREEKENGDKKESDREEL